jgi:hypothetical protein
MSSGRDTRIIVLRIIARLLYMDKDLKQSVENVLVLQGGGSLGAFAC